MSSVTSNTKKNILILGSTGPLGILTTKETLLHNFKTTIFVRNPEKVPQEIKDNKNVTMIVGQLTKTAKLFPLLPSFTHIISILGPTSYTHKGTAIADFYAVLLKEISTLPVSKRPYILALATPSQDAPQDSFSLSMYLLITVFSRLASGAYKEIRAIAKTFEEYGKGIQWTLYRVGALTDTAGKGVATAGWVGDKRWKLSTSRIDIARWLVKQMECEEGKREWVGLMPALAEA